MTVTYELRIKDRYLDLSSPFHLIGRHTGFELVIRDGDNITIKTAELLEDPQGNITFNTGEYNGNEYTLSDGSKVIWADHNLLTIDGELTNVETSISELEKWKVKTATLDVDNPVEIFNKIQLNAEIIKNNPYKLDYNFYNDNCNTWSQYMLNEYVNQINLEETLDNVPGGDYQYTGYEFNFPFHFSPEDRNAASLGDTVVDIIESQGGNLANGIPEFTWEDDKIHFQYNGKNYIVNGGNSPTYNTQDNTNIFSGNGADKISNSGSGNTINGSNGSDHIIDTGGAIIDLGPINPPTTPEEPQPSVPSKNKDIVEANPDTGKQTEIRGAREDDVIKTDQSGIKSLRIGICGFHISYPLL